MASLVDTNVLVYRFDPRDPAKQRRATAMRGTAAYGLAWFDAQIWAVAEVYGLGELLSEDFQHGRHYGGVRAVNPFVEPGGVHELPALYEA